MNTTHGLRRLHRCFAAVRAAFADVDNFVVANDAELAAAAAAAGVDSEWTFSFEMPKLVAVMT